MPVLRRIGQLATCPGAGPQSEIGTLDAAALVWRDDAIAWVGRDVDLPLAFKAEQEIDAGGRLVVPGLIDCHTHLAFAGWRADEFERRLRGESYADIARAGGGIARTGRPAATTSSRARSEGLGRWRVLGSPPWKSRAATA
jgi:imidazolonepropionase